MNKTLISSDYCENVCSQTLTNIKEKLIYEYSLKEQNLEQHYKSLMQNFTNSVFGLTTHVDSLERSINNMTATMISAVESSSSESDIKRNYQTNVLLNSTRVRFIESSKNSQFDLQKAILNLTSYFQVKIFSKTKFIFNFLILKTWAILENYTF